jgi:heme-degrading monooxygenase HmoA
MFVLNEVLVFTPGRGKEGLHRLKWIHGLMAPHPGFKHAIVTKYLGDATRHTIMRFWENEEAYQAFRATPDGNYGSSRPEGIYAGERVISPWFSYDEAFGSATGDFLVKVQREVPEATWDVFLAQQKAMIEVAPNIEGLVWTRLVRARGHDHSLVVARFHSRADFEDLHESMQYREMLQRIPKALRSSEPSASRS